MAALSTSTISAGKALDSLVHGASIIDVRSEAEFLKGHFAGTVNIPILNDKHRHEVGLTYRVSGQQAAIALGYKLVAPLKEGLITSWTTALDESGTVMCWRGGMRSQICCDWLAEHQVETRRVEGGYKQVRKIACQAWHQMPPLTVLGGFTGSRKTSLLVECQNHLDLEGLATHRGSAFGYLYGQNQPSQATFENNLALGLLKNTHESSLLVEDEGRNLGRCFLPKSMAQAITNSRLVWLEVPLNERVVNIYEEYVENPLQSGITSSQLCEHFIEALTKIEAALGSALTKQVHDQIKEGFQLDKDKASLTNHAPWITQLLTDYYDKRYLHGCDRLDRYICFRGNRDAVKQYLQTQGH
jgi:tRNA 2-selenouridine synthase